MVLIFGASGFVGVASAAAVLLCRHPGAQRCVRAAGSESGDGAGRTTVVRRRSAAGGRVVVVCVRLLALGSSGSGGVVNSADGWGVVSARWLARSQSPVAGVDVLILEGMVGHVVGVLARPHEHAEFKYLATWIPSPCALCLAVSFACARPWTAAGQAGGERFGE